MPAQHSLNGSCLCGAVAYRAEGEPGDMWFCHCRSCRKASGVAFATWIAVDSRDYCWTSGSEAVKTFPSSDQLQRCFCGSCGSVLPALEQLAQQRWLPAGGLQGEFGSRPEYHTYVAAKPGWFAIRDDLPRYSASKAHGQLHAQDVSESMPQAGSEVQGSCLCGDVAYRLGQPLEAMRSCHCSRCRCVSGSACFVGLPGLAVNLEYQRGEDLLTRYHLPGTRFYNLNFCSRCGSTMPGKLAGIDRTVAAAGSLDNDPGVRVAYHIFSESMALWHIIDDSLPSFDTVPPAGFQAD